MTSFIPDCTLTVDDLLGVATAVAGRWDLGDVIRSVSTDVAGILPHEHFDAAILSDDGLTLRTFETGVATRWGGATRRLDESPIRALFTTPARHIVTEDARNDAAFQERGMWIEPIFEAGLRARLHVAMVVSGRVIGALSFSRTSDSTYTRHDVANALAVSQIISPWVHGLLESERVVRARLDAEREAERHEGLRSGARVLTDDLERTRTRIGMELHDQTLADLSRISRSIGDRDRLDGDELRVLRRDVSHCLTELRRIVDSARPAVLELFGLAEAIRHQLDKESALAPEIRVDFDCPELAATGPPGDTEFGVFRIAQEAIHNAFKHAGAERIEVRLSDGGGAMRLSVTDDGRGLPDPSPAAGRGGLFNMRTRASLLGARLDIGPIAPSGTEVSLVLVDAREGCP